MESRTRSIVDHAGALVAVDHSAGNAPSSRGNSRVPVDETNTSALALPTEDQALRRFVQDAIGRVLVRRGVTADDLRLPAKEVYEAAINALRFSAASEELINMIAACMDSRTGHRVLPSYVDVIKQVSRDELELVRHLPRLGRSVAIAHVNLILPTNQAVVVYRNVVPDQLAEKCTFKDNIPQYIDNLSRLGLVAARPEDEVGNSGYRSMARLKFVKRFLVGAPGGSRIAMSPSTIALTDFGEGLRSACF
jgi:hypothetical protein